MEKTLIIAEVGVNHNADLSLAFNQLMARQSSGGCCKVQVAVLIVATFNSPKAEYQNKTTCSSENQLEMIKSLFPLDTFVSLKPDVKSQILFFSRQLLTLSVWILLKIWVNLFTRYRPAR